MGKYEKLARLFWFIVIICLWLVFSFFIGGIPLVWTPASILLIFVGIILFCIICILSFVIFIAILS